ncbi:Pimeloyl-ACP methyl ester carboxylesterase [Actinomyces denticolens]|uniref:Pimeloyl-ACP methyl ester carboxylesterase n=2 Tax=Actinomycetaceae TaxID=2049 RepID=A0ABY1I201_9ACTO|nr:Pimeloyl-ACP methyl ester carboxylesterase [Actinomyces denticolens]SUU08990.1 Tripeptidyl aminopeptidase precursor [Actinomyces denticolens]
MNRATRTLSIVTATACLLLSSCTAGTSPSSSSAGTTPSVPSSAVPVDAPSAPPVPAGLESYYSQKVDWSPCEDNASFECATVTVPLDYDDPSGQTIDLAVKKLPSTSGGPIGTLLTNPGGPGGSGVDYVSQEGVFSDALRSAYDIIGFDPRGVGQSTPLTCLSPQEISDTVAAELEASGAGAAQDPADAAQTEEPGETAGEETAESTEQTAAELASKCEQNSPVPGIIDHMDTASVARDMDVLRALSGDNRLHYLGVSYGTYLGARYAEMFPSHVGRMVLDSAQDPSRENAENVVEQAEAIEKSLHTYVEHCQSGEDCPLTGDTEAGVAQIKELIDKASASPLPVTIGQSVDGATLTRALIDLMYDNSAWDLLTGALRQAIRDNDGTGLAVLADPDLLDQTTDPQERAEQEAAQAANENAISAVDCLDYPVRGDSAQWEAQAERIKEVAPTLGTGLTFPDAFCQGWGHHGDHEPGQIRATGAAPILVIGITDDPATPYQWAQALASQLDSARLVTVEGHGHGAYGRKGECVDNAVDRYLLRGELPDSDLTCTEEVEQVGA